jgi:hypothetical protein
VDFTLGETQQAVAQAAAHVLDRDPPLPGHAVWKELGQAGLLGDELGVLDTAVLLTEVGRRAAPVPALATLAMGVLRTCHHLHGGTGMDVTYPLHRYSALVKDLVRLVGGADYRLDRLGARVGEPCSAI